MISKKTTTKQQQKLLESFTEKLLRKLVKSNVSEFKIKKASLKVKSAPDTDGWSVEIGDTTYTKKTNGISVFLDNFPTGDPNSYALWIGMYIKGEQNARKIGTLISRIYGLNPFVLRGHYFTFQRGINCYFIKKPLKKSLYGKPILELPTHTTPTRFIGIYFPPISGAAQKLPTALVGKCISFIINSVNALETLTYTEKNKAPKLFKNKTYTVKSKAIKRSSAQAKFVIRKANYTCEICDLQPLRKYGPEGTYCMEAHHIEPLHTKKQNVTNRSTDLLAVCANCHRILGRLPQSRRGLLQLKKLFV